MCSSAFSGHSKKIGGALVDVAPPARLHLGVAPSGPRLGRSDNLVLYTVEEGVVGLVLGDVELQWNRGRITTRPSKRPIMNADWREFI